MSGVLVPFFLSCYLFFYLICSLFFLFMLNRCSSKREISLSPLSYLQCCFSSSFHSFLVLFLAFFPCLCGNDDGDGINRGEYHLNPPLNETDILSRLHPETSFVCATMLGYSESSLPPWCLFSILRFFSLCVCACVSFSICFNRCCVLRASIFFSHSTTSTCHSMCSSALAFCLGFCFQPHILLFYVRYLAFLPLSAIFIYLFFFVPCSLVFVYPPNVYKVGQPPMTTQCRSLSIHPSHFPAPTIVLSSCSLIHTSTPKKKNSSCERYTEPQLAAHHSGSTTRSEIFAIFVSSLSFILLLFCGSLLRQVQ